MVEVVAKKTFNTIWRICQRKWKSSVAENEACADQRGAPSRQKAAESEEQSLKERERSSASNREH